MSQCRGGGWPITSTSTSVHRPTTTRRPGRRRSIRRRVSRCSNASSPGRVPSVRRRRSAASTRTRRCGCGPRAHGIEQPSSRRRARQLQVPGRCRGCRRCQLLRTRPGTGTWPVDSPRYRTRRRGHRHAARHSVGSGAAREGPGTPGRSVSGVPRTASTPRTSVPADRRNLTSWLISVGSRRWSRPRWAACSARAIRGGRWSIASHPGSPTTRTGQHSRVRSRRCRRRRIRCRNPASGVDREASRPQAHAARSLDYRLIDACPAAFELDGKPYREPATTSRAPAPRPVDMLARRPVSRGGPRR